MSKPLAEKQAQLFGICGTEVAVAQSFACGEIALLGSTGFVLCFSITDVLQLLRFFQFIHTCPQIALSICCIFMSLIMLLFWQRIPKSERVQLWRPYGTLNALALFAASLNIAYVSCDLVFLGNLYTAEDKIIMQHESIASRHRKFYPLISATFAAQSISYSFQFLFVSMAKLLVLCRLLDFAVGIARLQSKGNRVWQLNAVRKLVVGMVCVGCLIAIGASAALAADFIRLSSLQMALAHALESNSSLPEYEASAKNLLDSGSFWQGVIDGCEATLLPLIIAAYVSIGAHCIRIQVRSPNDIEVVRVKQQVTVTVAATFLTLLLHAIYAVLRAYANATSHISSSASCQSQSLEDPCVNPCRSLGNVIQQWMLYTPAFR
jgi:hypothetical protein